MQTCPVTTDGLCNSHGFCAYDSKERSAYCYCNEGYGGNACELMDSGSGSVWGLSYPTLANLMIVLLVVTVALVLSVMLMGYRFLEFRKKHVQRMQLAKADAGSSNGNFSIGSPVRN